MTMDTPAPQQGHIAIPAKRQEQEPFPITAEHRKLLARVAYLEQFIRQKGLSLDEETETALHPLIAATHPGLAATSGGAASSNHPAESIHPNAARDGREAGEDNRRTATDDRGIQSIARDIEAALSRNQKGTRTTREAELESLLWRALNCITVLKKAHLEVGQLRQQLNWRDQLDAVPATVLSQNQKAALRVTLQNIGHHQAHDADQLVQIESWHLCKKVGMSKQTFLEHLSYCAELGILRKQTEQVRDPDSQQVIATNYFVGTTALTAYPYKYQAVQPRNHGGTRARCKNPTCRSDRLQKRVIKHTMVICMECGEVQSDDTSDETVMLNDHLDSQVDSAADPLVVESTLENQDDHHTRPRNVNLTTYKTNVLDGQLDAVDRFLQEPTTPSLDEGVNGVGQTGIIQHQQAETDSPP